jgi:hypothetical protein
MSASAIRPSAEYNVPLKAMASIGPKISSVVVSADLPLTEDAADPVRDSFNESGLGRAGRTVDKGVLAGGQGGQDSLDHLGPVDELLVDQIAKLPEIGGGLGEVYWIAGLAVDGHSHISGCRIAQAGQGQQPGRALVDKTIS